MRQLAFADALSDAKVAGIGKQTAYGHNMINQPHMGTIVGMRKDICIPFHYFVLQRVLSQCLGSTVDAVFDIGCGPGDMLAELCLRSSFPDIPYYGGEISLRALDCVSEFAELGGTPNLQGVEFDIVNPDFRFLNGAKHILAFSVFALVYTNSFPETFFPALLDCADEATVVVFEPFSFSLADEVPIQPLFTCERARSFEICENFWSSIRALEKIPGVTLDEVIPDFAGKRLTALSAWSDSARRIKHSWVSILTHMIIHQEILHLRSRGMTVQAERMSRDLIAANANDTTAMEILSSILLETGKWDEAQSILQMVAQLKPNEFSAYYNLAIAFRRTERIEESVAEFNRAMQIEPKHQPNLLEQIGHTYMVQNDFKTATRAFLEVRVFLPLHAETLFATDGPRGIGDLSADGLRILMRLAIRQNAWDAALKLGRRLFEEFALEADEILFMTTVLHHRGKIDESKHIYLSALKRGFPIADYRPAWNAFTLALKDPRAAPAILEEDRKRYESWLEKHGGVQPTETTDFAEPPIFDAEATTGPIQFVGITGAVLTGSSSSCARGAKYRFEYGYSPDSLDTSTPWKPLPPPRAGRIRELAYRTFGNWTPRSTKAEWNLDDVSSLSLENQSPTPFLRLTGPFSKDRNQMNGIGSHEMPLNFSWCHPVCRDGSAERSSRQSLSAGAGVLDLRDAEMSFKIRARNLTQKGFVLTLWINHSFDNGPSFSQWALTGNPFPDNALFENPTWELVTLKLPNNPSQWTYTGSNPREQGGAQPATAVCR